MNDACFAELGFPSLPALVKHRQQQFFKKIIAERDYLEHYPLIFAINLNRSTDTRFRLCVEDF